ncbi:Esterase-like protein [Metarhizium album ARSEF 1941]|uniref:Esterase-like protein n=1 Tax=Metarhizium album (strain ARSEF 1941) TaxID=1081103 RepID=A0A0B2X338_METAS|nr:Esterase-like protein [Metarhizium album ARSEF 1941]KHN99804.1 Esterase-like protein [Metarhizium album ARSEF 1941]
MFPGGPNPTQVQFVPPGKAHNPPLPLVLIHDGGGTTFSYFVLGSLGRDVWAVHNPNYFEGLPWEGGMDEMAEKYAHLIAGELSGPVMLGGWSLGGYLSLAVARVIATSPGTYPFSVAGLLIIDSPYHVARSKITVPTSKPELAGLPPRVQKSFSNCDDMLQHWDLPPWEASPSDAGAEAKFTVAGEAFAVRKGEVLHKPVGSDVHDDKWQTISVQTYVGDAQLDTWRTGAGGSPPPAVLMRCIKRAKPKQSNGSNGRSEVAAAPPCLVDLFRDEKLLGWEARHPDFIKAVIDVDADHYNLFDRTNTTGLETVTAQLVTALDVLDALNEAATKRAQGA